ncbi:hypothetical protein DITRI_Ditri07aG0136900 [Diplodiscus trichospermus]
MAAETSPDWLPTGWTLQFKFLKTGRRITHYVNVATGQKFFTKDDLFQYTKTGSMQFDGQWPTLRQIKMPSANGHVNTATNANERPDWLPKDWLVEVKTRKSGATIGRHIKIYVEPSTGFRFYSKPAVFRFLNNVEEESSKSKRKERASHSTSNTAVKGNERPEWLPQNWFVELKARKSGAKIGKHYKIYVDPLTGFRFYSKPQVFQFLNDTEQKSSKPKRKKRASRSTSKVKIEKSTVDDLPAGWLKEVKIKRNANTIRRDPYYTDPASGYVFRSKKAVLRYLETGEISRDAFLPNGNNSDDKNLINKDKSQLPAAKGQKLKHPATRRQLFTGAETSDRSMLSDLEAETFQKCQSKEDKTVTALATASLVQIPERKGSLEHAIERNLGTAEKSSRNSSVTPKASKKKQGNIVSDDSALVPTAGAEGLQVKNLLESGTEKRSNINFKNSSKSKNRTELHLPRRFSNRLAQLEPQLLAGALELAKPCQNETNDPFVLENEAPQQLNGRSNSKVVKQASALSTVKSHCGLGKKTIKPIEDKDVTGKQPQLFETGDPEPEVQPFFSLDPCLEFTTKTLRGARPLEDAANEGLVSKVASNILQEKNLGKTRMENRRSNSETKQSSKFKEMKKPDLPRRSSKRLGWHESELVANGMSTDVVFQNATTRPGKNESKPQCVLVDNTTPQLNVGPKAKLPNQASAAAINQEINNVRPNEDRAILGEQAQMLGTQKGGGSKSELEPLFCSDPCLEFAIKTLTGAIPLEDAINEGLVLPSIANIQQPKNLAETRIEHSSCRKTLFNTTRSKNKDVSLPHRSSKRLAGHSPELVPNSSANEQVIKTAARKSCDSKGTRNADLTSVNLTNKACQLEIGPSMELERHDFTYLTSASHVESSNKSKEPHQNQTVPSEKIEKPGLQSAIPFGNSWSDPRFGFAFKTRTGSSPAEDSFAFQSHFNQQFGSFGTQRDGNFALPDTGLPNIFQSGISSHLDAMAQPVTQQQFSANPSFLPPGNVSLPSCNRVGGQQPYRKGKRNNQTR